MTTLELPDLEARTEPRRDRFGRYLIVPAAGGKPRSYTRATTWAKALDDMGGLINWSMRMCALGLTTRKDLYAQVAACRVDDRSQLSKLVDQAKEAGGGSEGANIGSALHAFTERFDLGEDVAVPDLWRPDVDAYKLAIEDAGLTVRRDLVERVVVLEEMGVAGTLDRVYVTGDGRLVIGDVKTGQSLDFSRLAIAVQLALYANAETLYDLGTETHTPMVDVDKQTALVVHLPSGQGRCQVVEFDIAEGWKYAQLAGLVRSARAHGKRSTGDALTRPYKPGQATAVVAALPEYPPEPPINGEDFNNFDQPTGRVIMDDYRTWILARLDTVGKNSAAKKTMREMWPADIPTFASGHLHTEAELRRLAGCLDAVERSFELAFHHTAPDIAAAREERIEKFVDALHGGTVDAPAKPLVDEGERISDEDLTAIKATLDRLPADQRSVLESWAKEANTAGRSFSIGQKPSQRRYAIYQALIAVAPLIDGDDVDRARATIADIVPDAAITLVTLGSIIGALTIAEAGQLRDLALTYRVDEPALTYDLATGAVRWATPTIDNTNDYKEF